MASGLSPKASMRLKIFCGIKEPESLDCAFDLICRRYGHYSRNYRDGYAGLADFIKKIIKKIIVKEHLGREKITARLDLFLKIFYVLPLIFAFGMNFGIGGASDAKSGDDALYVPYKVNGISVIPKGAVVV